MNAPILSENQKKRFDRPLYLLICFAMFCFWQMGFIYFIGPSLTINGKTPLPISMDNATALIVVCYVLSILWMIIIPHTVVHTQRAAIAIAIISALGLFLPLPDAGLRVLIYIQIFCCCLLIGFETFIMVNFLTEHSTINHLTAAYGVALFLIAVLQNDFAPINFPSFRVIMVAALVLLFVFFMRMPAGKEALPRYIKKGDNLPAPIKLIFGTYVLVFISALMGVSGPAISGEVKHGVFATYITDAVISFVLYALYKKADLHPFRVIPACMGLGGIGFLLMFAAHEVPALSIPACALIGAGLVPCQMLPLYGSVLMKSYPSKYISPIIIALAMAAVLVQSTMVELFRTSPAMLCLTYAAITVALVIIYMQIEPFFLFTLRKRTARSSDTSQPPQEQAAAENEEAPPLSPLSLLSKREREVVDLICLGYSNADIAKMLFISAHTVKDHTKKIYPKMGVHSRLELAALVSKIKDK